MLSRREVLAALGLLTWSERMRLFAKKPAPAAGVPPVFHIAADEDGLYGVSSAALQAPWLVWSRPRGQPYPIELAREGAPIVGILPHGAHVYYLAENRVLRVVKTGGPSEVMARAAHPPSFLAADRTDLYVSIGDTRRVYAGGAPPAHPGSVLRMPLAGGPLTQLVEHRSGRPRLALDDDRVYLATDDGIASVAKNGGPLLPLTGSGDPNQQPVALLSAGAVLYAAVQGELRRIEKQGGAEHVLYRASILLDLAAKDGWVYAVRNGAYRGPGLPFEPGGVVACSFKTGAMQTVAEPLRAPQQIAVGGPTLFVLELATGTGSDGLSQVREFPALPPV